MKIIKTIFLKILPVVLIFILAIVAFGFVGEKLGLMSMDDFLSRVEENAKEILKIEDEVEQESEVVDDRPLNISVDTKERRILESTTTITVKSNKKIKIQESERYNLIEISAEPYLYALEIKNIGVGEAVLTLDFFDEAGNVQQFKLPVERVSAQLPFGKSEISDWEGSQYVSPDAFDSNDTRRLAIKIDSKHKLIDDYSPVELVNVSTDLLLYSNQADIVVEKEAGEALRTMVLDLQNQTGKTLTILSGYRSFNNQVNTYSQNVSAYGETQANKISAKPGFSEHQLGTTIDFYSPDTGEDIFSQKFNETVAGKWLLENAHKYGFVQTLPEGSESSTGFQFEPWHWRFIGIENATRLNQSGQFFSEFNF